jgi:hypothetical protein
MASSCDSLAWQWLCHGLGWKLSGLAMFWAGHMFVWLRPDVVILCIARGIGLQLAGSAFGHRLG